jgi:hypothetical protein
VRRYLAVVSHTSVAWMARLHAAAFASGRVRFISSPAGDLNHRAAKLQRL